MYAMDFYVSTCRCVMQADPNRTESWAELNRLLPCLRQSLSCYVCFQILSDPMGPDHNVCKHSVCKACIGGKMRLKPSCSWCKDHWDFVPNTLLKVLISCFKKLCVYIYNSPIGQSISSSSVNGETNTLLNILKEVVEFDDEYSPASGAHIGLHTHTNNSEQNLDILQHNNAEPVNATRSVNPGCSSDDDGPICVVTNEENDKVIEETVEDLENVDQDNDRHEHTMQRRHFIRSSTRRTNGERTSVKKPVVSSTLPRNRRHKRVVFMKKKPQIKRNTLIRKPVVKHTRRQPVKTQTFHSVTRQSSREAPQDLEKIDSSMPLARRIKKELQPPQLKPPSFCKCGKTGNYNQLTCLGQRCPCYSMKMPCIGCKCKGCRNPKKGPDVQSNSINYMSDLWGTCSRTSSAVS